MVVATPVHNVRRRFAFRCSGRLRLLSRLQTLIGNCLSSLTTIGENGLVLRIGSLVVSRVASTDEDCSLSYCFEQIGSVVGSTNLLFATENAVGRVYMFYS